MEKKTMDTLRVMLCGELDDVAKKGSLTHESLDIVKDLLSSMKNLEKLEKMEMEKEMGMSQPMGGGDMGYSQRSMGRYYIDGEYGDGRSYGRGGYDRGGNSYRGNGPYMDGGSYRGGNSYDMGNSYMYYDPRYDHPMYARRGGYSGNGDAEDVIKELKEMMVETKDETVRNAISEAIEKMNRQYVVGGRSSRDTKELSLCDV